MNKYKKIIISFGLILSIVVVGFLGWFFISLQPVNSDVVVTIKIEGSVNQIIDELHEEGLIKSPFAAKLYTKFKNPSFKANTYNLNSTMSFSEICTILEEGKTDSSLLDQLRVIEGQTIPEVSSSVASALDVSTEEVLALWSDKIFLENLIDEYWFLGDEILDDHLMFPLEGYFAPETYMFEKSQETVQSLTRMLLNQTDLNLSPYKNDILNFVVDNKKWSVHEFITFASVVQNESLYLEDHEKIAGVFIHRLENDTVNGTGKKLQSDVTVNYANQVKKVAVTYADLEVDSYYNTYLYSGLPIGPISSVSSIIMESCINYQIMDELFFFAINDGSVIYTKTYAEHMEEIAIAKAAGLWLED